jgi:hypothetical protein
MFISTSMQPIMFANVWRAFIQPLGKWLREQE